MGYISFAVQLNEQRSFRKFLDSGSLCFRGQLFIALRQHTHIRVVVLVFGFDLLLHVPLQQPCTANVVAQVDSDGDWITVRTAIHSVTTNLDTKSYHYLTNQFA